MKGNYDNVAGIYDRWVQLVFGDAIRQAQVALLGAIAPGSRILIVGGGTGWILEEVAGLYPDGLQITYVELSSRMMALSRQRSTGRHQVTYQNLALQDALLEGLYDVVMTPFLFDNFTDRTAGEVFRKLHDHLREGGVWLYTDFQSPGKRTKHRLMLRTMYGVFRYLCDVEADRLPGIHHFYQLTGYEQMKQLSFYEGFIEACVYQKKTGE